jgi:UDP-N-acetylmuramate--alanine ligase
MDLAGVLAPLMKPGGVVVLLGAGSISHWANALPGELARKEAAA